MSSHIPLDDDMAEVHQGFVEAWDAGKAKHPGMPIMVPIALIGRFIGGIIGRLPESIRRQGRETLIENVDAAILVNAPPDGGKETLQ